MRSTLFFNKKFIYTNVKYNKKYFIIFLIFIILFSLSFRPIHKLKYKEPFSTDHSTFLNTQQRNSKQAISMADFLKQRDIMGNYRNIFVAAYVDLVNKYNDEQKQFTSMEDKGYFDTVENIYIKIMSTRITKYCLQTSINSIFIKLYECIVEILMILKLPEVSYFINNKIKEDLCDLELFSDIELFEQTTETFEKLLEEHKLIYLQKLLPIFKNILDSHFEKLPNKHSLFNDINDISMDIGVFVHYLEIMLQGHLKLFTQHNNDLYSSFTVVINCLDYIMRILTELSMCETPRRISPEHQRRAPLSPASSVQSTRADLFAALPPMSNQGTNGVYKKI